MELMVFDHEGIPEAGTRVPAGGIRPTESLREAGLREVRAESGLDAVRVVTEVGTVESRHPATGPPRLTSYWVLEVAEEPPSEWRHIVVSDDGDEAWCSSVAGKGCPWTLRWQTTRVCCSAGCPC